MPRVPGLHFVGFKGDEYWSAVRVFGRPSVIHRRHDTRMRRDVDTDNDTVVFANGAEARFSERNGNDIEEDQL